MAGERTSTGVNSSVAKQHGGVAGEGPAQVLTHQLLNYMGVWLTGVNLSVAKQHGGVAGE